MKQEEAILQSECFKWAWNNFPETRKMLFHIPNGGQRSLREASKFKAMGVIPGVPDMCFITFGQVYFFEFKSGKGQLSKEQLEWHHKAKCQNIEVFIINNFDVFKNIFEKLCKKY